VGQLLVVARAEGDLVGERAREPVEVALLAAAQDGQVQVGLAQVEALTVGSEFRKP